MLGKSLQSPAPKDDDDDNDDDDDDDEALPKRSVSKQLTPNY